MSIIAVCVWKHIIIHLCVLICRILDHICILFKQGLSCKG